MESEVTALEARVIAIRSEADASGIYKEVAVRIGNSFLQRRVLVLAREEQHRSLEDAFFAAQGSIGRDVEITDGVLKRIEMAFRAYDPCFARATHLFAGKMPLEGRVLDYWGGLLASRKRDC